MYRKYSTSGTRHRGLFLISVWLLRKRNSSASSGLPVVEKQHSLRIIAGLESATEGNVCVDGEIITGPSRKMAMIFQDYSLYPWRTVIENIAFGLEIQNINREKREKIAESYLDLVGLREFGKNYPYELSGGMRQRVAVARALAIDPSVLLMDEPFGALDAQTRNMLQIEILKIWEKTQKTVLFVTHSVDEAVFLADRIMVLTSRPGTIKDIVPIDLPGPVTAQVPTLPKSGGNIGSDRRSI